MVHSQWLYYRRRLQKTAQSLGWLSCTCRIIRSAGLSQNLQKLQGVGRKGIYQLAGVTEFHKKTTKEAWAYILIAYEVHPPRVSISFLSFVSLCLVLNDESSFTSLKFLAECFALLILRLETELHGVNNH